MRNYADSGSISSMAGQDVTVRGWVQNIRNKGGIAFVTIRDRYGTVQATLPKKTVGEDLFGLMTGLSRESVVSVTGNVKPCDQTALGVELVPSACEVLSEAGTPLPLGVVDKVDAEMDTRLNSRFMDLRKPEIRAIFEIRSAVTGLIHEFMLSEGFANVATPKICASGAEGGATLFKVDYFGKPAFLAQSPQLYKQMLMSSGIDRVYEIGPAFRAEHSNTTRHVTEFTSWDAEMSWISREEDVMDEIEKAVRYVISGINGRCGKQLALLGKGPVEVSGERFPRLTYSECLAIVRSKGLSLEDGADLGTDGEKIIGEHMAGKGFPLYFICEYPEQEKPFYIMEKDGTGFSFSFDLDYKGQEISSGGQREHRYDVLVARMEKKGLDPSDFEDYLAAFRFGMPPHGGWGIGIDRFVEKMLDLPNVREAVLFPRDLSRLMP